MDSSKLPTIKGLARIFNTIFTMKFVCKETFTFGANTYKLGPVIGEGSYGKVHLSKVNNKFVAIKALKKTESVQQEVKMMQSLKHENIVQFFEVIETSQKVYIVMEFIKGGDLLEKITTEGPMAEEQAKKVFAEIIKAVGFCHEQNIAHRDLKLENVLLRADGHVKLADFGFAVKSENNDMHSTRCGSANYVAPEVLSGKTYNSKSADIWSLGVILFAIVFGVFPSESDNMTFPASDVSESCKALISSMLTSNVEERATMKQIAESKWLN